MTTMTQAGLALGLLLILSLADIVEKRRLLTTMLALATVSLLALHAVPTIGIAPHLLRLGLHP